MAQTPSNMLPLNTPAPHFELMDTASDRLLALPSLKGKKGTLIMFICNHCPFVLHVNPKLVELAHSYQPKGIAFVAISSNDVEHYPQDAPERMKTTAKTLGYPFPYLYDASQEVAKAYEAACTPDFFLFDGQLKLVYRGQLDDSRPGNDKPLSGRDLVDAMDALLEGRPISGNQKPSVGCNIKWKPHW
ncbi:thioredoxin family protein [Maribacter sp. 2307ULW6-5]|uniref:thioredoxin family protein n=1 Tax=Maribacter sp. 2307ULW6-5 TaxID=3386275 RepID=UPI0039BC9F7E